MAALYGPARVYAAPLLRGDRLPFVLVGIGVVVLAVAVLALVTGRRPAKAQPPPMTKPRLIQQDEDREHGDHLP
ncbi:MAG: hypothetical protein J2P24_08855 [Streptosporangiales bacterium]|nr:hypothetical protein [Streptosporangiales bacterium]